MRLEMRLEMRSIAGGRACIRHAFVVLSNVLNEANATQVAMARLLLAHEGAADGAAAAGGKIYDKLQAHLTPLLGSAGVRALLARSAKLAQRQFSFLEVVVVESSTNLRECLRAQDAAVATESAATLFGTFFSLITTFIGERLTTQALRRAWPTIEEIAPATTPETDK